MICDPVILDGLEGHYRRSMKSRVVSGLFFAAALLTAVILVLQIPSLVDMYLNEILNIVYTLIVLVLFLIFCWLSFGAEVTIAKDYVETRNGFGWGNIKIPRSQLRKIETARGKNLQIYLEPGSGKGQMKIQILGHGKLTDSLFEKVQNLIKLDALNFQVDGY